MFGYKDPQTFAKGFVPNSINMELTDSLPRVGALIPDIKQEILRYRRRP